MKLLKLWPTQPGRHWRKTYGIYDDCRYNRQVPIAFRVRGVSKELNREANELVLIATVELLQIVLRYTFSSGVEVCALMG